MTRRVIEVVERGARLSMDNHLLVLMLTDGGEHRIPVTDIECLILGTSAVSVTGALLAELAEEGVMVVISNSKCLPVAMQLPLSAHYLQNERFRAQAEAPLPLYKRLWQSVVAAKIRSQGNLLMELHGVGDEFFHLADKVKSGDPENLEGRAAVLYWKQLFNSPFQRDRDMPDNNILLNYGYAILRAMTARALCGAGLHPTIGIHHHNRYNAYCLADDLMEPYRYIVDRAVARINPDNALFDGLSRNMRGEIIAELLNAEIVWHENRRDLGNLLTIHAGQLANSFAQNKNLLDFC